MNGFMKFRGDTIAITSLYPHGKYNMGGDAAIYIGGGTYKEKNDRMEWTGKSWGGEIPYGELLTWAFDRGFLQKTE